MYLSRGRTRRAFARWLRASSAGSVLPLCLPFCLPFVVAVCLAVTAVAAGGVRVRQRSKPLQLLSDLLVEGGVHGQRAQPDDVDLHLVEVVGDQLVSVDGLSHRPPVGGIGPRHPKSCLAHPYRLESHPEARVVHELQHLPESVARFSDQLRRRLVESQRRGHRSVVTELLFEAIDRREAGALPIWLVAIGAHQEHRQILEPPVAGPLGGAAASVFAASVFAASVFAAAMRAIAMTRPRGSRDHEVVFAVTRGDEDLLTAHGPGAGGVLRAYGAQRSHVATSVRLRDVHAAPSTSGRNLAHLGRPARAHDPTMLAIDLGRSLKQRQGQHRHGDAAVKPVVGHDRDIGPRQQLAVDEVEQHRSVGPAKLSRQCQPE